MPAVPVRMLIIDFSRPAPLWVGRFYTWILGSSRELAVACRRSPRYFRILGRHVVATGVIHLVNPKTDSLTTRPIYFNRALYSPLAGLLAVAACVPRDQYEVVLTDENIEDIDFDLKADLVGISAMTSYVNRGYEIADAFRAKGIPVVMGGVHPSFMAQEALQHCDAVLLGRTHL